MSDSSTFLPVATAYDRWAASYDRYDNPLVFAARRVMTGLATAAAGLDVVEFGCGTGQNLSLLRRHGARSLLGCDLSAGMLAQARARDPELRLWRQDMAQSLPLADCVADLALFCLSLEHVSALAPPLAEARRVLRPGGRLTVIEIHPFMALGGIVPIFTTRAEKCECRACRMDSQTISMPSPPPACGCRTAGNGARATSAGTCRPGR